MNDLDPDHRELSDLELLEQALADALAARAAGALGGPGLDERVFRRAIRQAKYQSTSRGQSGQGKGMANEELSIRDGQVVEHRLWADGKGKRIRGTIRLVHDAETGEVIGEVAWHGCFVSDELHRVLPDLVNAPEV